MRTLLFLVVPLLGAAVAAAACSSSTSGADPAADAGEGEASLPPPSMPPTPSSAPTGPAGSGLATGLPCDVQAVLENRCIACHDGKAAVALLTFDDLVKPSAVQPAKTMAQVSLERMKANEMPPAPAAAPEDDEIASFEEWIKAGTTKNPVACTDAPPLDGGVAGGDGGTGVCTSGKFWVKPDGGDDDEGSPRMFPGRACNACHQQQGGPNLRIAGTVYPTLHEADDCIGSAPPPARKVVITDSRNNKFELEVNESGNFQTRGGQRPRPPLKAEVVEGNKRRAMIGSVTSGDCNSCHTVNGLNGAPGRILAP